MNPLHYIVLAVLAFGAAVLVGSSIALGVGAALVAALVFAVVTSRPVAASISANRTTDASLVEAGSMVSSRVRVQAGGAFALRWLLVRDTIPPGIQPNAPTGRFVIGGSGLSAEFVYSARFPRRGVYTLGPVEASHGDILGLRTARQTVEGTDVVTVHPRVLPMPAFTLPSARPLGDRRADPRSYEDPTRPAGSRPYAYGDPMRRIHWPASARTGTLVSKVYDGSSQPLYVAIVNRCAGDYTEDRFELACTAAASLVAALARNGHEVGLKTEGFLEPDQGELHLERCLSALAQATTTLLPFDEQLLQARLELPWRATLLVVTERIDDMAGAGLEIMRRAGFAVAALVIGDPIETQGAIGRVAALGGSVARIEKEGDLGSVRFVGFAV